MEKFPLEVVQKLVQKKVFLPYVYAIVEAANLESIAISSNALQSSSKVLKQWLNWHRLFLDRLEIRSSAIVRSFDQGSHGSPVS